MSAKLAKLQLQTAQEFIKQAIGDLSTKRGIANKADPIAACASITPARAALDTAYALLGGKAKPS